MVLDAHVVGDRTMEEIFLVVKEPEALIASWVFWPQTALPWKKWRKI